MNEFELEKVYQLHQLPDQQLVEITDDLFIWLNDSNYTIYLPVIELLWQRQSVTSPFIKKHLESDKTAVKVNMMNDLIPLLTMENKAVLKDIIKKYKNTKAKGDDAQFLKESAGECYQYCYQHKPYIRIATEYDLENLTETKRCVWQQSYSNIYPKEKIENYDHDFQLGKFKKMIENPNLSLFIAQIDSETVGYMSCGRPLIPFRDYEYDISNLALTNKAKGKGLGKQLWTLGRNIIKFKGGTCFFVSCNKYNIKAQGFYRHMGGQIIWEDEDNEDTSLPQVKFHYDI